MHIRSLLCCASRDNLANVVASTKSEVYTQQRAEALFFQFADEDIPDVIAQVPLDGALPLLLAWQLDSHEMGKITKEEWMGGTAALRVSSLTSLAMVLSDLNSLIVLGKAPVGPSNSHVKSQKDTRRTFLSFYSFCFTLAKPEYVAPVLLSGAWLRQKKL
ncbi:hypothetical protein B0F90DRAFT_1711764 [Multifurca ochricompacta]|uniref:Uncharacterized protein n=1 Tax=Multifurca ochricompacta TaxID=376703 RepID=A0AAD4M6Y4_9AGAM|nr:hypothetical protein B0F90DRAFT_1711764 [Multifurca ochricompacta]